MLGQNKLVNKSSKVKNDIASFSQAFPKYSV